MYKLKKIIGKVFTSKFVGTGPSSYEKRIYRAVISKRLRNAVLQNFLQRLPSYSHFHYDRSAHTMRCL